MQGTIFKGPKYRLVMITSTYGDKEYGSFLFDTPEEAVESKRAVLANYPTYEVYLGDRNGNQFELPLTLGGAGHTARV